MKKSKIMLFGNLLLYLIIGGIIGGLTSVVLSNNYELFEFKLSKTQTDITSVVLAIIYIILVIALLNVYKKAQRLRETETNIDNEDEIEIQIERTLILAPVILGINTAIALSILNITINMAEEVSILSTLMVVVTLFVTAPLTYMHMSAMRKLYPERNYPKPGDKKLNEKLINMMDSGEQYITLLALQKTYSLNQQIIITIIALASIYSLASHDNQFFSVTLMILLYLVNTMYYTKQVSQTL